MEGPVPERSLNAPLQAPAAAPTETSRSPSTYLWAMLLAYLTDRNAGHRWARDRTVLIKMPP